MSHYSPVFFGPLEPSEFPHGMECIELAIQMDGQMDGRLWPPLQRHPFRRTLSKNWWLQNMLDRLGRGLGIEGLGFNYPVSPKTNYITTACTLLSPPEIEAALTGIEKLARRAVGGFPALSGPFPDAGYINLITACHREGMFETAEAGQELEYTSWASDDRELLNFYSYIKTLDAGLGDAKAAGLHFLFFVFTPFEHAIEIVP